MRYIVRTVSWSKERRENVAILKEQIPHLEVFTDTVGDYYGLFFEICRSINETGGVVLEDDVQLCRGFVNKVESVIEEKGADCVISFFERPKVDLETAYVGGSNFFWMQCVYFPPGLPEKFVKHYNDFKTKKPKLWRGNSVDRAVSYALVRERVKYWRIRPTLVQHLPLPSASGPRPINRQTLYFIDDLEGYDD